MNRIRIHCVINGEKITREVEIGRTLLEFLRSDLGLTGAKKGCEVGEFGACTVFIDGETIDACLYLAAWADGKEIRTIEGECADGALSPLQRAFVEEGAVQCGFCIPGFIMSGTRLLEAAEHLSREEIRVGVSGNLCRCTGYANIIRAIEAAAKADF